MRKEIWRLYQQLIVGSFIILACCYAAVEFSKSRLQDARAEQLLCSDGELSAVLLLSGLQASLPASRFSWTLNSAAALDPVAVANLLNKREWLRLPNGDYQLSFGSKDKSLLVGVANRDKQVFQVASLLKAFLLSPLSYSDKQHLLARMSCITTTPSDSKPVDEFEPVALLAGSHVEHGFLWKDPKSEKVVLVSAENDDSMSTTLVVIVIVLIATIAMLALIWRGLFNLDLKRKSFESLTRQIARGRGSLPKEIADSSGTLKELAYSFDSMSSHIQRLLKVQREMINAISHELRTPIARLRFGLEVVKDEMDESTQHMVEALEGDVEELNTLVDEVLTYGKLEEGSLALNFTSTSIKQLIDSILQNNEPLLKQLTVRVIIPEPDEVMADEHHLHRALQNLILNASKYANSQINIVFSFDEERWQIDIEDDGPGIAFEDRDKVFIPFQRLDNSRTRASGGYGLGLAIVQRIAFWHGGAVLVDASELGGAKFSLIWSRNQHQDTLT